MYASYVCKLWGWGRTAHKSNSERCHHSWHQAGKFLKFVPPDALKMHSQALCVFRFLCKAFPKLLKFTKCNTLCGGFFKNSYIQIKNLHDYKLVRAVKRSELKICCK